MSQLHHRRQQHLYGCLMHATYAVTGDETWLEHVADVSPLRWQARLHAAGLLLFTAYSVPPGGPPVPPELWLRLRDACAAPMPCVVTIPGQRDGTAHTVAVLVGKSVEVSDSALETLLTMPYVEFLSSRYAQALTVEYLAPADLNAYPVEDGALFASQADPELYTM